MSAGKGALAIARLGVAGGEANLGLRRKDGSAVALGEKALGRLTSYAASMNRMNLLAMSFVSSPSSGTPVMKIVSNEIGRASCRERGS